ncbi:MAG: DUF4062 domain-containing protein [Acidobacteriia bacterium]|nr:DUF4062 domain-containing protein [Terriglobia bacterium]
MRKPFLFVSSTCYDLKQLRADLYLYVESTGFEAVLSEYRSFPVDPDKTTIENCRKAIENRADIFVLVIGGRYGSVNEHGKSVTNLEYITAKAKGIPIYVFVMRSILDVLGIWQANPAGDFTSVVDSPKLFEFVSEIRSGGEEWIFAFDNAQDIISILRTQLAYLFADALVLRTRASVSGVLPATHGSLSGNELRSVIERPRGWEYLLFVQVLQREISVSKGLKKDWTYNLSFGSSRSFVTPSHFGRWIQEKISELMRIVENLRTLFDQALPTAFGPPGQSGDAQAILHAANRVGEAYRSILQWKLDFFSLYLDDELLKLRSLSASLGDNTVEEIEQFIDKLSNELDDALKKPPGGPTREITLTLTFTVPDQTQLTEEVARITDLVATGKLKWS